MGGTIGIVHSDVLCARLCIRYLPIGIGEVHGMVMHASQPSWLGQSRKQRFSGMIPSQRLKGRCRGLCSLSFRTHEVQLASRGFSEKNLRTENNCFRNFTGSY